MRRLHPAPPPPSDRQFPSLVEESQQALLSCEIAAAPHGCRCYAPTASGSIARLAPDGLAAGNTMMYDRSLRRMSRASPALMPVLNAANHGSAAMRLSARMYSGTNRSTSRIVRPPSRTARGRTRRACPPARDTDRRARPRRRPRPHAGPCREKRAPRASGPPHFAVARASGSASSQIGFAVLVRDPAVVLARQGKDVGCDAHCPCRFEQRDHFVFRLGWALGRGLDLVDDLGFSLAAGAMVTQVSTTRSVASFATLAKSPR